MLYVITALVAFVLGVALRNWLAKAESRELAHLKAAEAEVAEWKQKYDEIVHELKAKAAEKVKG